MNFADAVRDEVNETMTTTANGMAARVTTTDKVLDYFSKAGSSRGAPLTREFIGALADNEELALRALLWTRDVRGGAGERRQFRDMLMALEQRSPALAAKLMVKIPMVGRWDDLFTYQDPLNRKLAFEFISRALADDDGLCAKWMPRKGPVAVELRNFLGLSPKQYRKLLVRLTNVVESKMCAKDWDSINFSQVPSLASARYQKAFGRNAPDAYGRYIAELQKPDDERDPSVKINAGAVFPNDVTHSVRRGNAAVADAQWNALPNYVGDASILPMVDVSGSMGTMWSKESPMNVAVSLGLYLSEKNTGPFKDVFLTFSSKPEFVTVKGTLSDRINQMTSSDWGMNTNLQAAFDAILAVAVRNNLPQAKMPQTLLILSDMQFDSATRSHTYNGYRAGKIPQWNDTAVQMIRKQYHAAGYEMPQIVFWNLSPYGNDNTPVRFDESGTALVSGQSPAIMKAVLSNDLEEFTPFNVMMEALMDPRYDL